MNNLKFKRNYIIPLIFFIAVILDGSIQTIWSSTFISNQAIIVPHLTILTISFFSFYMSNFPIPYYAFFIGLLYDTYYLGYYGVYATVFFLLSYLVCQSSRYFSLNVLMSSIMVVLSIAFVDFIIYVFYQLNGVAQMDWQDFVVIKLWPTLLFNIVIFFIIYTPLKRIRRWIYLK
ncbi:rod shape-determining protein MreD [Atopobacter phocae]|uniref:rod shape-determining protein MreD n=1 Tax=Atopobacter phocae TaxID=136492 RepID=UPI000470315B|nr:rod shape-determining protein MreD [Atopobacter phocae]